VIKRRPIGPREQHLVELGDKAMLLRAGLPRIGRAKVAMPSRRR
jgi:hypothetical protein